MATLLFRSYRTTGADTPESFLAAIVGMLERYHPDVVRAVCDPVSGLPSRSNFLPSVAEVRTACEEALNPVKRAEQRKQSIEKQLRERDEIEAHVPPTQSYDDFCAEMAARGMPIKRADKDRAKFTPELVQAKFGITSDQWAAWPATNAKEWDKL